MHPHDCIAVADSIAVISVDVLARRGKQTVLPLMLFSLFWLCLTTVDMLQGVQGKASGRRPQEEGLRPKAGGISELRSVRCMDASHIHSRETKPFFRYTQGIP